MSKNISLLLFSADELLLPRTCPQLLCSIPTSPILTQKYFPMFWVDHLFFPCSFLLHFLFFGALQVVGRVYRAGGGKKGRFVIQPEPANKYQEHTLLLFSFSFSFSDSILRFFRIPWNLSLLISINFKNEKIIAIFIVLLRTTKTFRRSNKLEKLRRYFEQYSLEKYS